MKKILKVIGMTILITVMYFGYRIAVMTTFNRSVQPAVIELNQSLSELDAALNDVNDTSRLRLAATEVEEKLDKVDAILAKTREKIDSPIIFANQQKVDRVRKGLSLIEESLSSKNNELLRQGTILIWPEEQT